MRPRAMLPAIAVALFPMLSIPIARAGTPFLYRIEGTKPSWLFGTIHIPDKRVLDLSARADEAFEASDVVMTEIPMDPGTQMKMTQKLFLPEGQTLDKVLPKKLYARVDSLFSAKGLPFQPLSRFKIWTIATQVALIDHFTKFLSGKPLDQVIYQRASDAGKQVGGIETPEEQLAVFDSLSRAEQIRMLEGVLDMLQEFKQKGEDPVEKLILSFLSGEESRVVNAIKESYDPKNPIDRKLMKRLFEDRNTSMSQRIAARLKKEKEKSFFFAIGAGHLPGETGIAERLRKAGFKVTRVK
ncbi:MAG: TraB/GumN family protein [Deltaproteobacteria bacterium]|nr:TraB/GumN family protein [Deltaproteobacteria bacterium]